MVARLVACLVVIAAALIASSASVRADWFSRLARLAEQTGSRGAAKAAGALERAAVKLKRVPLQDGGAALAAQVSPEGHWTFVNKSGERFTAGTSDEMGRVAAVLAPEAAAKGGGLTLVLTEDTLFSHAGSLKQLPAKAGLRLSFGNETFPLVQVRPAAGQLVHAEVRPGVLVPAVQRAAFEETLWQLSRPLARARMRVLALETGGPHTLRPAPALDPATKRALADRIDPAKLPGAIRALAGQTAVVTGRVDGRVLHVRMASGIERTLSIDELFQAAAGADVNFIILNSPAPRQPGVRNWLWQRASVDGLDDAMKRATMGDFLAALGRGQSRFVVTAAESSPGRISLRAAPLPGDATTISGLSSVFSEVVSEVAGKVVTTGLEASLTSQTRQRELESRIVPGIQSDIQIAYVLCFLLGLAGLGFSRHWWRRIWPPEQRTAYAGRLGYEAARFVRLALFVLVFLPLSGPVAGPLAIIKGTFDNILGLLMIATWPVRALLRKLSHTRA